MLVGSATALGRGAAVTRFWCAAQFSEVPADQPAYRPWFGCDALAVSESVDWLYGEGLKRADVERRVVEAYMWRGWMSPEAARDVQAFQSRAADALDEVRSVLGNSCGDIWCYLDPDARVGLKIGVVASGDPPAGARVLNAKAVLKRHGLVDASEFVTASTSIAELVDDLARVSAVLGDSGGFARVTLRTGAKRGQLLSGNLRTSLWIETLSGLTREQKAIIDLARSVARRPVRISQSMGPGARFTPLPVTEVEWAPVGVGKDRASLIVMYSWDIFFDPAASLTLRESANEIEIGVALPDGRRNPHPEGSFNGPAIGRLSRRMIVRLEDVIGARRITGPGCLLAGSETGIARDSLLQPIRDARLVHVPYLVGLHVEDAQSLVRLQGLASSVDGPGSEVITTEPGPHELLSRNRPLVLRTSRVS